MLKGCSRKIYHVRNTSSKFFDEVYFVLKDGVTLHNEATTSSMAEEAERIIKEAGVSVGNSFQSRTSTPGRLTCFLVGVFTSSAILGIIAFLIAL